MAASLDDPEDTERAARAAARALDVPGLYRSPSCWGGAADHPRRSRFGHVDWALRCQAASFEIAVAIGRRARPFVEEHAFGPLELLHGVAMRALIRLDARGEGPEEAIQRAWERLLELDAHARAVALDALRTGPLPIGTVRRRFVSGLERLVDRARETRVRLLALDPLTRLAPERARRFLPDLRRLLEREGQHALEAALLVRTLDPRDPAASELLRHFAQAHPEREVRDAIEATLRPPRPVQGHGTA